MGREKVAFETVAVGDVINLAWEWPNGGLTTIRGPMVVLDRGDNWLEVKPVAEDMRYAFRILRNQLEASNTVVVKYT